MASPQEQTPPAYDEDAQLVEGKLDQALAGVRAIIPSGVPVSSLLDAKTMSFMGKLMSMTEQYTSSETKSDAVKEEFKECVDALVSRFQEFKELAAGSSKEEIARALKYADQLGIEGKTLSMFLVTLLNMPGGVSDSGCVIA